MSHVHEADDSSFETHVTRSEQPVLVDFTATWCGPCKKLWPLVEQIAGEYQGRLKVVKVDVDRAPATAAKFAVMSVPTLLFFRDGEIKDQVLGVIPKQAIADRVERIL
jgi:thioredoxin 1